MDMPKSEQEIGTDLDIQLRRLLTVLIRKSPKSREQIAEEMSVHAGISISKHMLDDWTAERREVSRRSRFPAFLIQSFCEVTGSDQLQRWAVGPRLRRLLEFGETAADILKANGRKNRAERC